MLTFLLVIVCTPTYFNNPYLVAKVIEVFFLMNPHVSGDNQRTPELFMRFMSHPICEEHLPSCLMKFYTGLSELMAAIIM